MTFNEFKTHMLILDWSYNRGMVSGECQMYSWRANSHIIRVITCRVGKPTTVTLYHNWERPALNDGAESYRRELPNLAEAIKIAGELS